MKKTLLNILIITFCIIAILGIGIVLLNIWNETTADILFTNITIFGFSIPTLCCAILKEKGKHNNFASTGIIVCALGCLYEILVIWGIINIDLGNILDTVRILVTFIVLATSFGHLSLMLLIDNEDSGVNAAKNATIIVSIIMDIMIISSLWWLDVSYPWQAYVIIGILIALGTIVTPILSMVKRIEARSLQQPVEPNQVLETQVQQSTVPVVPEVVENPVNSNSVSPVTLESPTSSAPVEKEVETPNSDNELALLMSLKDSGRITEEEYQILVNKIQNKNS